MIKSVSIETVPFDSGATLNGLSTFNFIFGSNGTGKTTISRVIADEQSYANCSIAWSTASPLTPLVYNKDYVDENFGSSSELKGVYTIGKENVETKAKLVEAKKELDGLNKDLTGLSNSLSGEDGTGGKKAENISVENELRDQCWERKKKYDPKFDHAFTGYRNSMDKFKEKLLYERSSTSADLAPLDELEAEAASVFVDAPTSETAIDSLETSTLIAAEENPILQKVLVGKDDVDIAAMIKKLDNSNWVDQGRVFYSKNDGVCPFCQQTTPDSFAQSLESFFDEQYELDTNSIETLRASYANGADNLRSALDAALESNCTFLDKNVLGPIAETIRAKLNANLQTIDEKGREPSRVFALDSLAEITAKANSIISECNEKVTAHNARVAALAATRNSLTRKVWRFLVEDMSSDWARYDKKKQDVSKAIASLEEQIAQKQAAILQKQQQIQELETETTSIQPAVDAINRILKSFGFEGFELVTTESGDSYRIVRPDGSDAKETLSEGERNFLTFLYFYHLLDGSDSEGAVTSDRIVVFDDPVSSLDSDVMFVVSSLIRRLCERIRNGTHVVKQVFVLTHNVFFHKEVTFNQKRPVGGKFSEETFWVVRKSGTRSTLECHSMNPISTTYELLWNELRSDDLVVNPLVQNAMRRILEHYFAILGGNKLEDVVDKFEGEDKLVCASLLSWSHAGSHVAGDEVHVTLTDTQTQRYKEVFRQIFVKAGQEAHYEMMMGGVDI